MTILPRESVGTLSYNGFTFPPAVKCNVRATPVSDTSGRITKYVRYELEVECMLFPGADSQATDGSYLDPSLSAFPESPQAGEIPSADGHPVGVGVKGMELLRKRLQTQGGRLVFTGKGFGYDFDIDTYHGDVMFGPKPQMMIWEPVASNETVRIVWRVAVHIVECENRRIRLAGGLTEFAISTNYTINALGLTTRTISGFAEIVNNRITGHQLGIDQFRQAIVRVDVPIGFQRTSQDFSVDPASRTMAFQIIDTEIPSEIPLCKGLVKQDITHNIKSVGDGKTGVVGARWVVTVRGSFEVAMGFDKGLAWACFLTYVKSRRDAVRTHARRYSSSSSANPAGAIPNQHAIPIDISITDKVNARGFECSISWYIYTTYQTVLKAGGLFEGPSNRPSWESYRQSMISERNTWDVRGWAQLRQQATGQLHIDPCGGTQVSTLVRDIRQEIGTSSTYRIFEADCPPKESSYTYFRPVCTMIEDHKAYVHYPTGRALKYNPRRVTPGSSQGGASYDGDDQPSASSSSRPRVISTGQARYVVEFSGTAQRVGHRIPQPSLLAYGGATVLAPFGQWKWKHAKSGIADGCQVYWARWKQYYVLDGPPSGELIESDPTFREFPE